MELEWRQSILFKNGFEKAIILVHQLHFCQSLGRQIFLIAIKMSYLPFFLVL